LHSSFMTMDNLCQAKHGRESSGNPKHLIAVCQMTSTADKDENLKTMMDLISKGSKRGAKMVFFPEACDYIAESKAESLTLAEDLDGHFVQQCRKAAMVHNVWLSIGGFHQKSKAAENVAKIINTHLVISDQGQIEATYAKSHLFDLDIPGKIRLCESDYTVPGQKITPPVPTPIGRVGLATCYDLRFPEMSLALAQGGAHILTFPSAFTQVTGKAHWETLLRARAIETQCYVVAAAQTGSHNSKRSSHGHSMVVDPWGEVLAEAPEGPGLCVAEVDLGCLTKVRTDMPVWQHRRPDLYGRVGGGGAGCISPDDESSYQFGHVTISSAQVFYRSNLSIAFVNIKPVLPGHMLISPIRPAETLADLRPAEVTDLFMTVQRVQQVVMQHFGASSATVAVQDGPEAGQTVKHVHIHILPRKKNDFSDNDDVYDELQNHDKGWNPDTKLRSEEEMSKESEALRAYFAKSL